MTNDLWLFLVLWIVSAAGVGFVALVIRWLAHDVFGWHCYLRHCEYATQIVYRCVFCGRYEGKAK